MSAPWRKRIGITIPSVPVVFDLLPDGTLTRYGHARIKLKEYWPYSSYDLPKDSIQVWSYQIAPSLLAQLAPDDDCDYIAVVPPKIREHGRFAFTNGYPPFLIGIAEDHNPLIIDFLDNYIVLVGIRPWVTDWSGE